MMNDMKGERKSGQIAKRYEGIKMTDAMYLAECQRQLEASKADYQKLKDAFEEVIYGRFDASDWRRKAGLEEGK